VGARKKKAVTGTAHAAPTGAEFTVVLEDLRSQFKVFGESLEGLREEMHSRFEQVDARFAQVDARLAQGDSRFDKVDRRLDLLQTAVLDNSGEIRELRGDLARKVDRDEVVSIVDQALARR